MNINHTLWVAMAWVWVGLWSVPSYAAMNIDSLSSVIDASALSRARAGQSLMLSEVVGMGSVSDATFDRGQRVKRALLQYSDKVVLGGLISKDQAKKIALQAKGISHGDKVVSVKLIRGGKPKYKVRIIRTNGRVKNVTVDAKSGAIW